MRILGRVGQEHPRWIAALLGVSASIVLASTFALFWFVLPYSGNSATLGSSPESVRAGLFLFVLPLGLAGVALSVRANDRRADRDRRDTDRPSDDLPPDVR